MNKKTQQIVGVVAILGLGYWAYTKYGKKKSFANLTSQQGCTFYPGSVSSPNGTILQGWGTRGGVIVNNGQNGGQTLVCPVGQTNTLPSR